MAGRSSQAMYDRHITIFSPDGNLYQVEYAMKAVRNCNLTCIAVKGDDSVCLVVQKKAAAQQLSQDRYMDIDFVSSLYALSPTIGSCLLGLFPDCRSIASRAKSEAGEFAYKYGYSMPVYALAKRVADLNQVYTQFAYMRLHACTGIMISYDEENGPSLYKFDPAGFFAGYKACASGTKEQEATNVLEKMIKKRTRKTLKEVVEVAIASMQQVLGMEVKAGDVEVGVVSQQDPNFRLLTESEIEDHLVSIAERE